MVTGRYSRPDNVFSTTGLSDLITRCEVIPSLHPTSTDHFPIVTNIMLPQEKIDSPPSFNFREVNWDKFNKKLKVKIDTVPNPRHINNQEQLNAAVESLTVTIQETIKEVVTITKPRPDKKRWWNGDLARARRELNRLRNTSYKNCAMADHPSHKELRLKSNRYGEQII
jgi:hypothetical protein